MAVACHSVLLMSNDPFANSRTANDLRERGYRVHWVSNDADLRVALDHVYDLVLVDFVAPPRIARRLVVQLNRRKHGGRVFAMHDGSLAEDPDAYGALSDLGIDAFCRRGEVIGAA